MCWRESGCRATVVECWLWPDGSAGRATTAEDIVQQALQVAYNARGQLKKTSATGAWLVRITYSVGLRIRSKRARRQELLREHWLREGDSLEVAGSKADPRVAEVLEAMQGLPASQQEIVRCVLVDGLSDGEIAEKSGRPRGPSECTSIGRSAH